MNLRCGSTRWTFVALAAGTVLLAGCGSGADSGPRQAVAPEVGVYQVKAQPLTLTTRLPGRTAAYRVAEVRPQVSGILQRRLFTEGAVVRKGQQLYQIDDAVYQAEYKRAKANLVAAQGLAQRYQALQKNSAISRQQYDDAVSAWKQAQAQADLARINLDYTKVYAPIAGRIGRSAVSEGALVTNGQTQELATVQQLDPIYVDVTQPVKEVLRLQDEMAAGRLERSGDNQAKVTLRLEDGSIYPLAGALKFSEVAVDQSTSSVTLRAEFPNPDGRLLPGMFVQAQLVEGVSQNAILVPQQALQRDPKGEASVWVVDDKNKAVRRAVTAPRTQGNQWLVSHGLQDGERVVTEGLQRLHAGVEVIAAPAGNVKIVQDFGIVADAAGAPPVEAPSATPHAGQPS